MYGSDVTTDDLYTVNLTTGVFNTPSLGDTGVNNPSYMTYTGSTVYGVTSLSTLHTVNINTGEFSAAIGSTNVSNLAGIAYAESIMYGVSSGTDSFYTVDLTSGAYTLVSATGTSKPYGLAYAPERQAQLGDFLDTTDLTAANANPTGIAVTSSNIYVVDSSDDEVYIYNSSGVYQSSFDTAGDGVRRPNRDSGHIVQHLHCGQRR